MKHRMKKRRWIVLGICSILGLLLAGCGEAKNDMRTDIISQVENSEQGLTNGQSVVKECIDYSISSYEPLQRFSYELFAENMEETNPVLSPVSAYLALALTGEGAREDTLQEFHNVLGEELACIPNELMTGLPRETEGMILNLANSAWVDDRLTVDKDWLGMADSVYHAEVYQTKLASETAMKDINQWISNSTRGLIPCLLEKPLNEDDCMVLLNTIYFKGDWQKNFMAHATRELEFTLENGSAEVVEMMQMFDEKQLYVKNDVAEGVILPYQDDTMAFVALKPIGDCPVREMYEQLSLADIETFIKQEEQVYCNLRLPRFQVEFEKKLNESLKEMGLKKAFSEEEADFSGLGTLASGRNMFISLVQQKAVVIVDEAGTEAAAVTEVMVKEESCVIYEKPPVELYFDEPFLYMIVDRERGIPLFIGIMDNPNA